MDFKSYCLIGGAGFIGAHFVDALLAQSHVQKVTVYDNLSSGKAHYCEQHQNDERFFFIHADIKDTATLQQAIRGHEVVMHFAANPDIARAVKEPDIDFTEGMYLTFQMLEAARITGVKRIIYTSGSGVYGEVSTASVEDQCGMYPISTYGASKLGSEAFICSYCHLFDLSACVFRFANVVGPRQTHGVGYDFIKKLRQDPTTLEILGDGLQSKSYLYIDDVISAVFLANQMLKTNYAVYNVATQDAMTVREIADLTIETMGLAQPVELLFTGGDRGWKGDVPVVRLNTDKIRALGWSNQYNSYQAVRASLLAMLA